MRKIFFFASLLALGASPALAQSQTFNLRDLLTDFLRAGITLAPPTAPFPSHEAHFIGADSPQFLAVQQFNSELATQLSTFPLASSAGGFTYRFDPALGVFVRDANTFGPIYAERFDTIGEGKFNLGVNYSHFAFDRIGDLQLADGDVRLVFTHKDTNGDSSNLEPWFEGDVITTQIFLKIETNITAFAMTYGVSDRFDVGFAIPIVSVRLDALAQANIQRIATGASSQIHRFLNGTTEDTFRRSGSAAGVGDVVLRGKFRLFRGSAGGLSIGEDLRLPTGDERSLLGTGTTQSKTSLIGSLHLGTFSPHVNAGYTWSAHHSNPSIPDEIDYTAGFDWALHPRLTLAADVLGRTFRRTRDVVVADTVFHANTNTDPSTPPVVSDHVFPRLISRMKDVTTLTGSVGVKINPFGNFLLTVNGLFSINNEGLQTRFAPLVGLDYSF